MNVSVVVPSYNHADYIGETIESILSQDIDGLELCIVDDGSNDDTVGEIKRFKDPRIKLHCFEENRGASIALSEAIRMASGTYIAVCNSDDCFLPGKLKLQKYFLDNHPDIYALFGLPQYIDQRGNVIDSTHYKDQFRQKNRTRYEWLNYFFYKGNAFCHPTVMIRRECYEKLNYLDPVLFQLPDFDFWIRFLFYYDVHLLDEELTQFRVLDNGQGVSAPGMATYLRTRFELSVVLERYLNIKTILDFKRIFPGVSVVEDDDLIPYYLAKQALSASVCPPTVYRNFGLRLLFDLLHNPVMKKKIEEADGYTLKRFVKDMGSHFVFADAQENRYITGCEPAFFQTTIGNIDLRLSKIRF